MIQISEEEAKNLQELDKAFYRAYDYFEKNLPADPDLAALVVEEALKRMQRKKAKEEPLHTGGLLTRYIDADKLLADFVRLEQEAFEECQKAEVGTENYKRWSIILNERTSYKYDVMDAPTEDVEPVRHARWVYHESVMPDEDLVGFYECSNCHVAVSEAVFDCTMDDFYKDYCGACGATMDGKENE